MNIVKDLLLRKANTYIDTGLSIKVSEGGLTRHGRRSSRDNDLSLDRVAQEIMSAKNPTLIFKTEKPYATKLWVEPDINIIGGCGESVLPPSAFRSDRTALIVEPSIYTKKKSMP